MPLCCKCGTQIFQGFYAADYYYCESGCLDIDFSKEDWEKAHEENSDEYYWSTFDED